MQIGYFPSSTTLTCVWLLVVLACLVAACTLGMLASLLALADVVTYRLLLFHLLGLLEITKRMRQP
jgi:hypothetical protein